MGFNDEYAKLRKKRQQEFGASAKAREAEQAATELKERAAASMALRDIAPVKETKKTDERTWFQKGAFEDGYQFGDISKTFYNTVKDAESSVVAGILGIGEGVVDAGAYVAGGVGKLFGADEFAEDTKKFIAKDLYDEKKIAQTLLGGSEALGRWTASKIAGEDKSLGDTMGDIRGDMDEQSVFGDKTDDLLQSGGQLLGTAALSPVVPWFVTTGVTSFGGEAENAFNEGAGYLEAGGSALISAGAEILTEKLSGGIKFGGKTLGDAWVQPLVNKISNKVLRTAANLGLDALGEGGEEVISQIFSNLGSALYREESLDEILASEEALDGYIESFIGGAVLGGGAGSFNAVNSAINGRDYKTGLTANEQKVLDKEIENRITNAESDGKTLTSKEKAKLREEALSDLKKGYISTDTIESVLGGEGYKAYQDAIAKDNEAIGKLKELYTGAELDEAIKGITENSKQGELKEQAGKEMTDILAKGKDTYLSESYNEIERRKQAFEADISKYDEAQAETIKRAAESGVLNNTRRTHDFVDLISKISADKGVAFDFTNNEKLAESGFAVEGKTINGLKTENGISLNVESKKALNTVVGHEITHVLEGTEFYAELKKVISDYAAHKGDYKDRLMAAHTLYKDIDGYKGAEGLEAIEREVTADLVGEYLFTDADFVKKLTSNRNIFQKLWDEIKYLCKIAGKGSNEAKELARVQHAFEQAYNEYNGKTKTETATETTAEEAAEETKYSLTPEQEEFFKDSKVRDENGDLKVMYHGTPNGDFTVFKDGTYFTDNKEYADRYQNPSASSIKSGKSALNPKTFEVYLDIKKPFDINDAEARDIYINDYIKGGNAMGINPYLPDAEYAKIKTIDWTEGEDLRDFLIENEYDYDGLVLDEGADGGYGEDVKYRGKSYVVFSPEQIKSIDNKKPTSDADIRYSLSEADNTYLDAVKRGDTETAQKMVNDAAQKAGYTIKAYHGTPNTEFTVFDKNRLGKGNDQYGAGFYFATDAEAASHYGNRVIDAALNIKNPIRITATADSGANLIDADVTLTQKQAYEVIKRLPDIYDAEESPLGDYYDSYWEEGAQDWMIRDLARKNRDVGYLDSDLFRYYPNELHEALRDVVGYDGVEVTFEKTGEKFYVAWFDNQMKSADAVTYDDSGKAIPLSERFNANNNDIRYSLSENGETPKTYGNYNVYGEDVRLEAPTPETISKTETVDKAVAPAPESSYDEGAPVTEEEASAMQGDIDSFTDADVPDELDAPFYGEEEVTAADPFENRDIKEVGNRKVKAYMYENPEVKPFFQAEANVMLGELQRSTKGERFYNDELYYETNGEKGFFGTERETSGDIEYLLDELHYTYAQIEKGLKAIIEDNGAENNAVSKRIEFLLNDRLLKGTTDFITGAETPPNQDYINLVNEKQILEYSEEAQKKYFEATDELAPMAEAETAAETAVSKESEDIAPVAEQYEPIRPPREKQPSMKRVNEDGSTEPKGKQRKFVKTATESDAVDGKILPKDLEQGKIHYQPIPNKVTLGNANTRLESMGYDTSLAYFNSQFKNKSVGLDDIALGERLIQEAIKRGDNKTAGELIQNVAILGTELGQKVQALSIIKRLTPEGQLGMLRKTVERGKARGDKAYEGVEITQEMIDKILGVYAQTSPETVKKLQSEIAKLDGAKLTRTDAFYVNGDTYKHRKKLARMGFKWDAEKKAWYLADASGTFDQAALDKAVEEVKQDIAKQMNVTKLDKVNAWRYLSMLGNPKTHIRNLVSNVAMQGTLAVKNAVARSIESIAPVKNRTRTWKRASEAVSKFAETTTAEMKDVLSDGGKYSEDASIKAKRATFKNKVLNGIYEFNSNLLTKEDWWFSKGAFKSALSEYLTANGISTEADIKNNPEIVEKAKAYATEQSQIATFRQYSWLANKINEIERKNAFTNIAVGSIVPFKKTPINIAKTGLSYSPLGFAKTLTYDAAQVKNGKMEASELVDHLAQNLTGSALTLAGYMLAMSGFLNGAGDDDKEGKYDYQLGKQAYSINIGGQTFSLSWLSPIAMPLFVGANAYEQLVEGKEWSGDVVVETLAQTLDPLSEMSFLSSLDSVLSSYDSGIQKFAGIGETMAQNYITQFVPTLSSQTAAVFDDTKRSTKVAGNSNFEFFDRTINNLMYKIPGLRNMLEPTTDIWGNDVKQSKNIFARAFETFLAPYARKENIATEIDEEIKALYGETGDDGIIPAIPNNYVNYDGEKHEMSAEEYTAFKKTYGQTACGLMEALFGTDTYRNATSEERAEMVGKVYDYARDEARKEYFAGLGIDFTNAESEGEEYYKENPIKGAIEEDLPVDEYTFAEKYPEKYSFFKENGISYETYRTADEDGKRAYTWAYENPEKLPLAKAIAGDVVTYRKYAGELYDIKADKDASGKSISGSRKEKVIDYINNMDADYGEKIILFKSEYNADDTYNADIVEYLNSRQDISREDMETILKELGFTVHSNGRVTW